jgi:hypothetical protein
MGAGASRDLEGYYEYTRTYEQASPSAPIDIVEKNSLDINAN